MVSVAANVVAERDESFDKGFKEEVVFDVDVDMFDVDMFDDMFDVDMFDVDVFDVDVDVNENGFDDDVKRREDGGEEEAVGI